ncbi:collagen alpha-1(III) chain-like [Melospiza georgiana]|uniref:collagen alpha-1(III) chain-like n=1 Tax=Melospiza georgiana TaxID=44398 RepID=UPI0025AB8F58|nr:collagen alpha-1(III) chain-like [Melospiza georgiana]
MNILFPILSASQVIKYWPKFKGSCFATASLPARTPRCPSGRRSGRTRLPLRRSPPGMRPRYPGTPVPGTPRTPVPPEPPAPPPGPARSGAGPGQRAERGGSAGAAGPFPHLDFRAAPPGRGGAAAGPGGCGGVPAPPAGRRQRGAPARGGGGADPPGFHAEPPSPRGFPRRGQSPRSLSPRVPAFVGVPSGGGAGSAGGSSRAGGRALPIPQGSAGEGSGTRTRRERRLPEPSIRSAGARAAGGGSPSAERGAPERCPRRGTVAELSPVSPARSGGRWQSCPLCPQPEARPPPAPRPRPISARTKSRGALRVAAGYPGAGDARVRQAAVRWFWALPNVSTILSELAEVGLEGSRISRDQSARWNRLSGSDTAKRLGRASPERPRRLPAGNGPGARPARAGRERGHGAVPLLPAGPRRRWEPRRRLCHRASVSPLVSPGCAGSLRRGETGPPVCALTTRRGAPAARTLGSDGNNPPRKPRLSPRLGSHPGCPPAIAPVLERREHLPEQTSMVRQQRSLSRSSSKSVFSFAPPAAEQGVPKIPGTRVPSASGQSPPLQPTAAAASSSPHARRQQQVPGVPQASPHRRGTGQEPGRPGQGAAVQPRRSRGAAGRARPLGARSGRAPPQLRPPRCAPRRGPPARHHAAPPALVAHPPPAHTHKTTAGGGAEPKRETRPWCFETAPAASPPLPRPRSGHRRPPRTHRDRDPEPRASRHAKNH